MNKAFYGEIKKILSDARNKVYQTANFAMVEAYWQIGKSIVEEQNGEERAEYGTGLLKVGLLLIKDIRASRKFGLSILSSFR